MSLRQIFHSNWCRHWDETRQRRSALSDNRGKIRNERHIVALCESVCVLQAECWIRRYRAPTFKYEGSDIIGEWQTRKNTSFQRRGSASKRCLERERVSGKSLTL